MQNADIILSADPLYSPLYQMWLANAIERFLNRGKMARVVVELPLRNAYVAEIEEFEMTSTLAMMTGSVSTGSEYEKLKVLHIIHIYAICGWGIWAWAEE